MNKNYFEVIPFMEIKYYVEQTCLMYLKLKETGKAIKKLNKNMDLNKFDTVSIFENIIKLLTDEEALIIKNDFIKERGNANWYLNHWCKSSYYKYKHDAINKFLYLFFS